jgi:hypothetical protein
VRACVEDSRSASRLPPQQLQRQSRRFDYQPNLLQDKHTHTHTGSASHVLWQSNEHSTRAFPPLSFSKLLFPHSLPLPPSLPPPIPSPLPPSTSLPPPSLTEMEQVRQGGPARPDKGDCAAIAKVVVRQVDLQQRLGLRARHVRLEGLRIEGSESGQGQPRELVLEEPDAHLIC